MTIDEFVEILKKRPMDFDTIEISICELTAADKKYFLFYSERDRMVHCRIKISDISNIELF
jgi:hypothetical protein